MNKKFLIGFSEADCWRTESGARWSGCMAACAHGRRWNVVFLCVAWFSCLARSAGYDTDHHHCSPVSCGVCSRPEGGHGGSESVGGSWDGLHLR